MRLYFYKIKNLFQILVWVSLLIALISPVQAAEGYTQQVEEIYEEVEGYGISPLASLEENLSGLGDYALRQIDSILNSAARTGVQILGVVLLCGMMEVGGLAKGGAVDGVAVAGALAVSALAMGEVSSMIGLGRETIGVIQDFATLILPVMAVLTAATGSISLAAVHQGATVLFAQLLISLIDGLLVPMVYLYLATCCGYAAVGNEGLKRIGELIRRGVIGALTGMLIVFIGYLTVTGAIAGSADSATVKAAKIAMSRAIPVVGGILSDAAETMLVGAGVLRTSVGVVGLVAVIAICLVPFLRLVIHYLTFQIAGALAATVAEQRLSKLIEEIGTAFGLILGMAGTCALLLMISLVSAVTAVVP